jgi:uncharacterized membrane protein
MSQAEQAQKGFKTFILTLSLSLIVFSAVYYVITTGSTGNSVPDIESSNNTSATPDTVFGALASQKVTDVQPQSVLAAEDGLDSLSDTLIADGTTGMGTQELTSEPTQATGTPQGGVTSITMGLLTSLAMFMYGLFVISRDPRRLALKTFENRVTRDFEN